MKTNSWTTAGQAKDLSSSPNPLVKVLRRGRKKTAEVLSFLDQTNYSFGQFGIISDPDINFRKFRNGLSDHEGVKKYKLYYTIVKYYSFSPCVVLDRRVNGLMTIKAPEVTQTKNYDETSSVENAGVICFSLRSYPRL